MAGIPKCRCHLLRSHRRSRAWCCISCASTVIPLSQPGSPANTRRTARSSTWEKVASASKRWRTWLSTHEARRVEVERAKRRGCLTRSVKLAQLVRYCSFSAEAVTIAWSAALLRACPRRSTWPLTGRRGRPAEHFVENCSQKVQIVRTDLIHPAVKRTLLGSSGKDKNPNQPSLRSSQPRNSP